MNCPVARTLPSPMTTREGIEIDYCRQCRGVWLDRGELDKLIERSGAQHPLSQQPPPPGARLEERYAGHHSYRRKSWLTEIVD